MNDTFIVKTCDLMVSHPIQIDKTKILEIKVDIIASHSNLEKYVFCSSFCHTKLKMKLKVEIITSCFN